MAMAILLNHKGGKAKPKAFRYGVRVSKINSNPETRVTYIADSTGFTPMNGNDGNFLWGSWEDKWERFGIKPCVLKNGVVQYYLDPNDYTKKEDGTSAVITGADGDVMVEFAKILWWKFTDEGDTYTVEISDAEFTGAVKHAFEIEDGYNLFNYYPFLLTQILFLIFFKSTDSQTALGQGFTNGASSSATTRTGNANTSGLFFGSTTASGEGRLKFLGVEDFWGNYSFTLDGIVTDENYNILIGKSGFNDFGEGYELYETGRIVDYSSYIKNVYANNDLGFLSSDDSAGSSSTYYSDVNNFRKSCFGRAGGNLNSRNDAGIHSLLLSVPPTSSVSRNSARLFYNANEKIYIGAYLSVVVSNKLRSISDTTPTGTIIATQRTQARANNT